MIYSFEPIIDNDCKVLVLGTMPGVQSLRKQQYYGNKQNAFWRIVYTLFDGKISDDYAQKKEFLLQQHIALWDVLEACDREGSLDADIKNPVPNDFVSLFKEYPGIKRVYFNGEPAQRLFEKYVKKDVDKYRLRYHTLPSTSPANVVKFEDKLRRWKLVCYELLGMEGFDIKSVEVSIDNYQGHSYKIDIDCTAMYGTYKSIGTGGAGLKQRELALSPVQLIDFIHMLYASGVLSPKNVYKPGNAESSATRWSVKIASYDDELLFKGNGVPKKWRILYEAVQLLTGESFTH